MSSNEEKLNEVSLDFEQRRRAELLAEAINDNPLMAAFELISLRDEVERQRRYEASQAKAAGL